VGADRNPDQDTPAKALRWLAGQAVKCRSASTAFEASRVGAELARTVCEGLTDLRGITDLNREQAWALLALAKILKDTLATGATVHREILAGKTLAMVFEKPSLRTRVSFEVGMFQLGGHALYLQPSDIGMGKREPVADVARVLGRMADGIMARVFAHDTIVELAQYSETPVINGLCDLEHPCQALADFLTVWEKRGSVEGQKVAYIGDGNNVAHSLALLGGLLGAHVAIATPQGYEPNAAIIEAATGFAAESGGSITITTDPAVACKDADAVYTDVWASMGQEAEAAARAKIFAAYQVDEKLFALAKTEAIFLHCLPAHRGEEASAEVVDHTRSAVWDQAENRLHAQKAVLAVLMG
jgi:ornithine carbamoyltransferase